MVARAVVERARAQGIEALSVVDIEARGAFEEGRFQKFFTQRLNEQLGFAGLVTRERGRVGHASLRIVVSIRSRKVWALGFLEPISGRAPIPFAVSRVLDDELAYALGVRGGQRTNRRWSIERMGHVGAEVLDMCFVRVNDDGEETVLAVLTTENVELYNQPALDEPLQRIEFSHDLGATDWPRVVAGWMGAHAPGKLWVATTGIGRSPFVLNLNTREIERAPFVGVPIRQVDELGGPRGQAVASAPVLGSFRDVVYMAKNSLWARVDADGRLLVSSDVGAEWDLGGEQVGDRLALSDLDDDEIFELVTTRASQEGEADELTIRRVDALSRRLESGFRRATDGPISALAVGRFRADDGPAVWFVEELPDGRSAVWRVVMR
jgi:hypothetical protein